MNLKPIGDKIIVKKVKPEERTVGGIVLPDSAKEAPQYAIVVSIGPDILADEKKKDQVNVGDKVVYTKYSGTEIKVDDEEMIICKLADLLAIVE
ncbi:MAG: co-chaperone GroES [Tissierellia bacterium]|nr:co-chaperone GroES [Tissierellia bacterium]